ncbi:MAG: N-acetyltransferase [Pseudomonadota bacterium]
MSGLGTPIAIRPEAPGDESTIFTLTQSAFAGMEFSGGTEGYIVDKLREDGDLTLSLVALDRLRIVGHIAISPVTISDGASGWYGLGPVSVAPEMQRAGIGGLLIRRAIEQMRERGAKGIVLLGSTEYYPRFGFRHEPQLRYPGPPPEYFQCLLLEGDLPSGNVAYSRAFG